MICLKINSFYKITSVGLNGRENWEKIAKYKKSNCGCKKADRKKKKEQVKWCARDAGRSSKSTGRITGGKSKGCNPSQSGEQVPIVERNLGLDLVRDAPAALNGSMAHHRWKQKTRVWVPASAGEPAVAAMAAVGEPTEVAAVGELAAAAAVGEPAAAAAVGEPKTICSPMKSKSEAQQLVVQNNKQEPPAEFSLEGKNACMMENGPGSANQKRTYHRWKMKNGSEQSLEKHSDQCVKESKANGTYHYWKPVVGNSKSELWHQFFLGQNNEGKLMMKKLEPNRNISKIPCD